MILQESVDIEDASNNWATINGSLEQIKISIRIFAEECNYSITINNISKGSALRRLIASGLINPFLRADTNLIV